MDSRNAAQKGHCVRNVTTGHVLAHFFLVFVLWNVSTTKTLRIQPRLPRVYAAKRCAPRTRVQEPDTTPSETVQDADQKSGVRR